MLHFIYELIDPRDEQCRYVGITVNPNARFTQHMTSPDNMIKVGWLKPLQDEELEPRMNIIEIVDSIDKAREREKYWIQSRLNEGHSLTNMSLIPPEQHVTRRVSLRGLIKNKFEVIVEVMDDWEEFNPDLYMDSYHASTYCHLAKAKEIDGEMRFIHLSSLVKMKKCRNNGKTYYHKDDVRDFALWLQRSYPELLTIKVAGSHSISNAELALLVANNGECGE